MLAGIAAPHFIQRTFVRPRWRESMTIAAGFNFPDGIVLCADTKHAGSYKVEASKILTQRYGNGAMSAFVYAGNMRYCRMAIESFESQIASLTKRQATLPMMRALVEKELVSIHKGHIYVHPRFRTQELSIGFVGAIWSPRDGLYNFSTDDTSIIRFRGYDCIGSGEYLAHFLIRPRYKSLTRPVALDDVLLIAISTLMSIREYDADCGGKSEFVVVRRDGQFTPVKTLDISHGEHVAMGFREATDKLLLTISNPKVLDEQVMGELGGFSKDITRLVKEGRSSRLVLEMIEELEGDVRARRVIRTLRKR